MAEVSELEMYLGARELLADPKRWAKGALALDEYGQPAGDQKSPDEGDPLADDAVCWCLVGACCKVAGEVIWFDDRRFAALRQVIGGPTIGPWQDQRTHADVLAALDMAITLQRTWQP